MRVKVALITGASSGIGLAVARKLAKQGTKVALVARTQANLDAAVRELGADNAAAFALDVKDLAALQRLPARTVERFGGLDILVNNAGLNYRGPMLSFPADALADVITTNLTAPVALCRAAAEVLRPGGSIVNVASLAGMVPVHHEAAYSASKAGLRAFSRAIRGELSSVKVSLVSPGPVDTSFFGDVAKVPPLVFSQPMSTPEQVADAVLHCIAHGDEELVLPWLSGKLCTLGYLSSTLVHALRPAMERRGERNKRAYLARKPR